jgi:hypothetical protein
MIVKLKKEIKTIVGGITFPANVNLLAEVDDEGISIKHPKYTTVYIRPNNDNVIIVEE